MLLLLDDDVRYLVGVWSWHLFLRWCVGLSLICLFGVAVGLGCVALFVAVCCVRRFVVCRVEQVCLLITCRLV